MTSTLDQINALSEEWHACYHEMGVLAEGLAVGQGCDEGTGVLLVEKVRAIDGKLLQLYAQRRYEKRVVRGL